MNRNQEISMVLSAAILVGRSTRMGRDKALLTLDRQTFIGRLAGELSVCHEVFLSVCHEVFTSAALKNEYAVYGLPIVPDENRGIGPIEGIRQSLRHAEADYVFICAVDMPFVHSGMIRFLAEQITSGYDVFVYRDAERIHPLCGIYSRAALPSVERMIADGRYRLSDLLAEVSTKYVDISGSCFSGDALRNINTPEEYRAISGGNSYNKTDG